MVGQLAPLFEVFKVEVVVYVPAASEQAPLALLVPAVLAALLLVPAVLAALLLVPAVLAALLLVPAVLAALLLSPPDEPPPHAKQAAIPPRVASLDTYSESPKDRFMLKLPLLWIHAKAHHKKSASSRPNTPRLSDQRGARRQT
jgi:hypothetical protein